MKLPNSNITHENLNRIAIGLMEHRQCSYEESMEILNSLRIHFEVGLEISESIPLQAALITAINTAVRCFLGGVTVSIPGNEINFLLPWNEKTTLFNVVKQLGGQHKKFEIETHQVIVFGTPKIQVLHQLSSEDLKVVCNEWQAGVIKALEVSPLLSNGNTPLGGIAAGALSISLAFSRATGIDISAADRENGISLWRPDLHWLDKQAMGPKISYMPKKYWLLGLGHLGQASLWALSLFEFRKPSEVELMLQDTDKVIEGNISAGLLCTREVVGQYKTRVCSQWLTQRRFSTKISERRYDNYTIVQPDEPALAICGFDNASSRTFLEITGFKGIIECGLGGRITDYDKISIHTFPESHKTPDKIWSTSMDETKFLQKQVQKDFEKKTENPCGILAETLASTSISTSFVGAFSGALIIAECARGVNNGYRFDTIDIQLRSLSYKKAFLHRNSRFLMNLSSNGFAELNSNIE